MIARWINRLWSWTAVNLAGTGFVEGLIFGFVLAMLILVIMGRCSAPVTP